MKQYSVRLSQNAYNDLESIYSYISYQLLSPETAANIYNELLDSIESLKVMPKRVPLMKSTKEAARGYRLMSVKKYAIIFKTVDDETVEVLRILYGPSDIVSKL